MCPVCIANAAAMVAGAGSTGGVLAVCIGKIKKLFTADRSGLFKKLRRDKRQTTRRQTWKTEKKIWQ